MNTQDQILAVVLDLKEGMGRLDEKVDGLKDIPNRVSTLEHDKSRLKGIMLVLSVAGGAIVTGGVALAKALL